MQFLLLIMRIHLSRAVPFVTSCLISTCLLMVMWSSVYPERFSPFWDVLGIRQKRFIASFKAQYQKDAIRLAVSSQGHQSAARPVWPSVGDVDDRIVAQLNFQPTRKKNQIAALKKILLWSGLKGLKRGQEEFIDRKCLVQACSLTADHRDSEAADLILFSGVSGRPWRPRPRGQIWMTTTLEAPMRTGLWSEMDGVINWTATYRHDSTIVTPYGKFVPYSIKTNVTAPYKDYSAGKTKKVAWFVSNCFGDNDRMKYAEELAKYISVDIYGSCGPFKCPKGPGEEERCFSKLNRDYKFYLSFENANCRDYITEKFFKIGLQHDVVPIVMGAAPEDYERAAPYHSYIHVEQFASPKELASYLNLLDTNDDLYNTYFAWKDFGEFIDTKYLCRVCALLHDANRPKSIYKRLGDWWNAKHACSGHERWDVFRERHNIKVFK